MNVRTCVVDWRPETAMQTGSSEARHPRLRRVTDLFLAHADQFTDQQIGVFDDVLGHLIERSESEVLAGLSERLPPIERGPAEVIGRLARGDEIAFAGPVLAQSGRLTTRDLVEIAETKSQAHLLAISSRGQLGEFITDALLQRSDRSIDRKLASNAGARFSETGISCLIQRAENDEALAEKVGSRRDIPLRLVRQLVFRATKAVRSRLLAVTRPEQRAEIRRVLSRANDHIQHQSRSGR